jgi:hypothetical protein
MQYWCSATHVLYIWCSTTVIMRCSTTIQGLLIGYNVSTTHVLCICRSLERSEWQENQSNQKVEGRFLWADGYKPNVFCTSLFKSRPTSHTRAVTRQHNSSMTDGRQWELFSFRLVKACVKSPQRGIVQIVSKPSSLHYCSLQLTSETPTTISLSDRLPVSPSVSTSFSPAFQCLSCRF